MTTAERLKKISDAEDTLHWAIRDHPWHCRCVTCLAWISVRRVLKDVTTPGFEIFDRPASEVTP
jgi:hypothetical protein